MSRRKRKERAEGKSMEDATKLEKMYRLSTIADRTDIPLRTIQEHARKGILPVVHIGGSRIQRVRESDVRRYLEDREKNAE
jgi:predicted site-specific integrase-resolvase